MTPEQLIKHAILTQVCAKHSDYFDGKVTAQNVDAVWDLRHENDSFYESVNEELHWEFRGGTVKTGIKAPDSRHYECRSVAAQMECGTWVGWDFWYGGGKHGEPESVDWIEYAYFLDCEERTEVVQHFTKAVAKRKTEDKP